MLRRIPPRLADVIVVLFVGATSIGSALNHGGPWFTLPPTIAATLLMFLRRRRPLLVLAGTTAASVGLEFAGIFWLGPAVVIATWTAARELDRAVSLRASAASLVAVAIPALIHSDGHVIRLGPQAVFFVAAWLWGDASRARDLERDQQTRQAAIDERARIARELHDMVTHNVSVMVVQAAAGNEVLDSHPEQARAAFRAVEDTGRRALGELRRLLDVVAEQDGTAYDPQPGLDRIGALVESVRSTGLGVELTVEGTPQKLSPAVELSAFRIVQESLTNTLKHARASRASVRVRYEPDALELEVADDGVGALSTEGGRGLVGMRERVALFGGALDAGARPGGGFAVRARMPLEAS
jgi:signal transduction histidine kinase